MRWYELTWQDIDRLDRNKPVVIPLGACEQHGLHLPVFVDTFQTDAIAGAVEKRLENDILLLPTQWLGSSDHHKDFPGTLSLAPSLYAQVIQTIAQNILDAGFKRLFFLNGHGGNRAPAAGALSELVGRDDRADDAYLTLGSWWEIASEGIKPEKHAISQPVMAHACEYETSLMLALHSDLVHLDRLKIQNAVLHNDWFKSDDDSAKRVAVFRRFHRLTATGHLGHAQGANPEKGQALFNAAVDDICAFLTDFAQWPALPPLAPEHKT